MESLVKETEMLAEKLKTLREAKSWSQGHLADAAQINIRTVQRIEGGEPASSETLLSLAAALGIDVSELQSAAPRRMSHAQFSRAHFAAAAALIAPAALFLLVNLLRSFGGVGAPYEAAAATGARLMSFRTFNLVSPVIFLGGPAVAIILCLPALVRLRTGRVSDGALCIDGLEVRRNWAAVAIVGLAALSAGTLLAYAAMEALRTPVR
jgi:transcriptional regulator with XRE-family HTH domain